MIDYSDAVSFPLPPEVAAYYDRTRRNHFGEYRCRRGRRGRVCGACAVLKSRADAAYRAAVDASEPHTATREAAA